MVVTFDGGIWLQMTLEEAIGYVASDELIEVNFCMQFTRQLPCLLTLLLFC